MKAILVAGGVGSRLRPLTNHLPKPMITVGDKPIIQHALELLKAHGIRDFIFALCYKPEVIMDFFGDGKEFGVQIEYVFEELDAPLGTAGAISPARELVNETFIVSYADIVRDLDVTQMLAMHREHQAIATLSSYFHGSAPKSIIEADEEGRLLSFIERPNAEQLAGKEPWSNASFYIFEPEIFAYIPEGKQTDFGYDIFPKLLAEGKPVFSYPSQGYFIDIGTREKLEKARADYYRELLGNRD